MVNFARLLNLHSGAVVAVTLGFVSGAGLAVATDVKYDEFEQYETAFMAACTGWSSPRTCYCAMADMEKQIGFEEFARATLRTQGDVFNDQHWDRAAFRAVETCVDGLAGHRRLRAGRTAPPRRPADAAILPRSGRRVSTFG